MKRNGILNAQLSHAIATLGHTDLIMVVDAGFPIPAGVNRIDLAVAENIPDLRVVLRLIAAEVMVEGVLRAEDVVSHNPLLDEFLQTTFAGAEFTTCPHTVLLGQVALQAKAIVRTGAFEPWGNVGLFSGVDVPKWFTGKGVVPPAHYASRLEPTLNQPREEHS